VNAAGQRWPLLQRWSRTADGVEDTLECLSKSRCNSLILTTQATISASLLLIMVRDHRRWRHRSQVTVNSCSATPVIQWYTDHFTSFNQRAVTDGLQWLLLIYLPPQDGSWTLDLRHGHCTNEQSRSCESWHFNHLTQMLHLLYYIQRYVTRDTLQCTMRRTRDSHVTYFEALFLINN